MTDTGAWTAASVTVGGPGLSVADIASALRRESAGRPGAKFWTADLLQDDQASIDEVLGLVGAFIAQNSTALRNIAARQGEIEVRVGWTPTSGMAGLLLSAEIIALLAEVNANFALDIYAED